ncbi:Vitamin K epoxide reductase [Galdieria sulphuraria]|nr:Vitamin K epoxide reductase [Galdieria sulphuraria]
MSLLSKEDISSSSDQKLESSSDQNCEIPVKILEEVQDSSFLRKSIMILSSIGVIDTVYLTVEVFKSPLASIFGVPLSFLGFMAYSAVFLLSACPLLCRRKSSTFKNQLHTFSKKALSLLTLAMTIVSAFLMYILFFQIQSFCPYCVLSAFLSGSLFITSSFLHFSSVGWKKWIRHSFVVLLILASITGGALVAFGTASMTFSNQVFDPPSITSHSNARMMKLAERLKSKKARMYGAFWCEHCYHQKQMFGQEAFEKIEYVECSKNGRDSQYNLCREKDVPGYPTWEIDGELYPGEQSVEELEELAKAGN